MNKSILTASMTVFLAAFAAGAATLSGTVRAAASGGSTGAVIAEAKVVLYGFGGGGAQTALDTATTNAQGRYSFSDVAIGYSQVIATKTGYLNGVAFANVTQSGGEYTANITMPSEGGDAGVVSGTVRSGTAQGPVIANALVVISRSGGGDPDDAYIDSMRTNAQGMYRFDSVPAVNNYVVRVTATDFNPASNSNVDVNEGDTTVANFTLTPIPGTGAPGSIGGTVRRATNGEPIANAGILLTRNGTRVDSLVTDADGHFAIAPIAPNTNYSITVRATGFQTATNSDVDVSSNQTTIVDFSLIATGPNATLGTIIGTVMNNNRKGIANARVILSRPGTQGGSGPIDTVESDANGDFTFEEVPALANYTVSVTAAGYQSASNTNVDVIAGQSAYADVILQATVGVRASSDIRTGFRLSRGRGALLVEFQPSPWAGRLSAYDARGALAFTGPVPAGAAGMDLPSKASMRFLVLERGGMIERIQVAPVR